MSLLITAPFVFRDFRATVGRRNLYVLRLLDGVYVSPYRHAIEAEKDTEMTSQCGAPEPEIQQVRHQNIATDLNPPPRGVSLCAAEGLVFSEVFSQQFRLSAQPEDILPGFQPHRWSKWVLQAGPDLPVASSEFDNGSGAVFFLGIGVDPGGTIISSESLATQLDGVHEPDAVAAYLSQAAGRYVFVIFKDETQRIYLDPIGSLGVLFDPLTGAVGSTLNILLSRDVERNTVYPFTDLAVDELGRFAFGHTEDVRAKRVLPNHFLDLATFQQQRHWPGPGDIQEPSDADEEENTLGKINDRLGQIIKSLSQHASRTMLPLSGGLDSRILLACGRDSLGELKLYSHAENMMSRKDVRIATKLAGRVGSSLVGIDPARDAKYQIADQEAKEKLQAAYGLATAGLSMPPLRHEILQAYPKGGLVLRGNGVDFLKAVLWRRGVNEYKKKLPHDIKTGIRMMMLAGPEAVENAYIQERYHKWYAGLDGLAADRAFDFMFSEQFLSHGFGNMLYGFTRNFYICPSSDRLLLGLATGLPPDKRAELFYTEALLAQRAPELQHVKYARKAVNELLKSKRAI